MSSRRVSIGREIRIIRRSLASIDAALGRLSGPLGEALSQRKINRKRLTLTPQRRAQLKQQGQYMGYLRNLPPKAKARVKSVKASKGYVPAITLAKRLARAA